VEGPFFGGTLASTRPCHERERNQSPLHTAGSSNSHGMMMKEECIAHPMLWKMINQVKSLRYVDMNDVPRVFGYL
jgi:hypothetical protein